MAPSVSEQPAMDQVQDRPQTQVGLAGKIIASKYIAIFQRRL